jgi:hypothetical protein
MGADPISPQFFWGGKSYVDSRYIALYTITIWYGEQYNNEIKCSVVYVYK